MAKTLTVQDFARMGGKARTEQMTKAQRVALARKAAKARWDKAKKTA